MNNELLLLMKKHTDTLIEQTKTKPQETVESNTKHANNNFFINPQINLSEEGKLLLTLSSFEAMNSVFNITDENKRFSNFNTRVLVFQMSCRNY